MKWSTGYVRINRDLTMRDIGFTEESHLPDGALDQVVYRQGDVCQRRWSMGDAHDEVGVWQADALDWWFVSVCFFDYI